VEKIALVASDIEPRIKAPVLTGDIFNNVLVFLNQSSSHVEQIYILDKRHAFDDANDPEARNLIYERTAAAGEMLRDLLYRAWLESGTDLARQPNPIDPKNPAYNPSTGSAPPPLSPDVIRSGRD
jgi:hypothetical protein